MVLPRLLQSHRYAKIKDGIDQHSCSSKGLKTSKFSYLTYISTIGALLLLWTFAVAYSSFYLSKVSVALKPTIGVSRKFQPRTMIPEFLLIYL